MKFKILCVVCLLLSSASYCFAQIGWETGYYKNDWGELDKNHPYFVTDRGVRNTGDEEGKYFLYIKVNEAYIEFAIFDNRFGDKTNLDLYSPLKIVIRDSEGNTYNMEQTELRTGSLAFLNFNDENNFDNCNFKKLIQAISTGSFQISISGYNEIRHNPFRILYNVDIDLQSFKEAWAWYSVEMKRLQKSR